MWILFIISAQICDEIKLTQTAMVFKALQGQAQAKATCSFIKYERMKRSPSLYRNSHKRVRLRILTSVGIGTSVGLRNLSFNQLPPLKAHHVAPCSIQQLRRHALSSAQTVSSIQIVYTIKLFTPILK